MGVDYMSGQMIKKTTMGFLLASLLLLAGPLPQRSSARVTIPATGGSASRGDQDRWQDKVVPDLLADTAGGERASFLVIMAAQAELGHADRYLDKDDRSRFVYERLTRTALASQKPLQAWLDRRDIPYRSHYLINMLAVEGDQGVLEALARRADIAQIRANRAAPGIPPAERIAPDLQAPGLFSFDGMATPRTPDSPSNTEWGVDFVNAPAVWSTYGIRGEGIVVANNDTGVDWDHPALIGAYRGWDGTSADHNYNWFDPFGGDVDCPDPTVPCDDHGHGTHTNGSAVGDDGGDNQIGVAPGAQWIGCRNMDSGVGTPESYTSCFEFLLAPFPPGGDPLTQGNPDLGAHIVNNSWGCPPSEGCDHFTLRQVVQNVRTAGVLVVASAGNNGSACTSVLYPIGTYDASFTVGNVNSSGTIAGNSSRGPVEFNGTDIAKPDISAPGTNVRSSRPGGYGFASGTSMAAPHVAGTAALLWSAEPELIGQIGATEYILTQTADHVASTACGSDGVPNNTYGWGYVDALAAVQAVLEPAQVTGQVTESQFRCDPSATALVPGAQLTFEHAWLEDVTIVVAVDGTFATTLAPGRYTVSMVDPAGNESPDYTVWLLGNRDNPLVFSPMACQFLPELNGAES
ncbi:MAG: S8 family serine peptidase [Chloroflexota bacterium]|nr:S8 family serine peptidase [Chloroflexota bacterium]